MENLPSLNQQEILLRKSTARISLVFLTYHPLNLSSGGNSAAEIHARISACLTALRGDVSSSGNSAAEIHSENLPSLKWLSYQHLNIFSTYYKNHSCDTPAVYLDNTCNNRNIPQSSSSNSQIGLGMQLESPLAEFSAQLKFPPSESGLRQGLRSHSEMDLFPAWSILADRRKAFL